MEMKMDHIRVELETRDYRAIDRLSANLKEMLVTMDDNGLFYWNLHDGSFLIRDHVEELIELLERVRGDSTLE